MMRTCAKQQGVAWILALIMLAVFATVAGGLAATTNLGLRMSKNSSDIQRAQRAAESGLAFGLHEIRLLLLPGSTTPDTVMANLFSSLGTRINGTGNLHGASITLNNGVLDVPAISLGQESFHMQVFRHADGNAYLEVTGNAGQIQRTVSMQLALGTPGNSAFDYGLASRGSISISGNGEIRGKNMLTEASVISTTDNSVAIAVGGSAVIDGDLSSVGQQSTITISGTPTVAGSKDIGTIAQHVHFGVEAPVFPEVDTSIFRALATGGVIDKNTNTGAKDATYSNVVIKAGTNPTFSSDVTLNGVVYVEAPNIVTFTSKVTINGLVATDTTTLPMTGCKLNFAGQVEAFGVEALPNLPQYTALKALQGTFIAADGFDVSFAGQFTTINGTIAASKLTFSGQAAGTVKGSVIGLADCDTSLSGTVNIYIDRSGSRTLPPGFHMPVQLKGVPATYAETAGL